MKKILLTLITVFALAASGFAQTWNMVIIREDGTRDTLKTSAVKQVTFFMPDQNVDQVIIKELYVGGCPPDQGKTAFQSDKGFILYNNCPQTAVINNLAVGILNPYNGESENKWYDGAGKLIYAADEYHPGTDGLWYFQAPLVIKPFSQVVVNVQGAINNTLTHSKSVNYAHKDYYAMYDPEVGYAHALYYPAPSELIPTAHHLKAVRIGQSTAWALSSISPAFFIFQTQGMTPAQFGNDVNYRIYVPGGKQTATNACFKVPTNWILDGVEVFGASVVAKSKKRFTPEVDGGYVLLTNKLGHSLYRNVDKARTEALPENAGKLIYNYSMGVSAGDPSNIDAEASIKNGAHIIYMDTNNSTNDFHERKEFSLRNQ
ncbi:MAG: DUF4876 domain-containing protein [Prevotella sp.]|nr:MAG: DUF4876 domain-containing protein [Prevotella sp.]